MFANFLLYSVSVCDIEKKVESENMKMGETNFNHCRDRWNLNEKNESTWLSKNKRILNRAVIFFTSL